jgi:electron transfer flavoprotein beta subunit
MKAKKKKIDAEGPGVDVSSRVKIVKVAEPPVRQGGGKVDDVAGLVAGLKDKGLL